MDTVEFTGLFLKFRELTMIKDINTHFHPAYERSEISSRDAHNGLPRLKQQQKIEISSLFHTGPGENDGKMNHVQDSKNKSR